ncbi:MORN repeat-containing protein 3 [Brachionichthys hirsutus]|uniref:MORN repeat-containing protein 3 n=1 Tax=Brachionichthys hirsutus TaxID=412623 RepID=UPI003604796D
MSLIKLSKKKPATSSDSKSQSVRLHAVYSPDGNEYRGEWKDKKKHGKGIQVFKKSGAIYDGEWEHGKPDGFGTYSVLLPGTKQHVIKYRGLWTKGKKHGNGTFYYDNSSFYEGEWNENNRSGWGEMHYESGDIYEGEWENDKRHGQGALQFVDGNWYEGFWRDGKKNGAGKFYHSDKGQLYEGVWEDGNAKCGTMSDFKRDEARTPTKHPIPELHLVDGEMVLREAQSPYLDQC